MVYFNFRFQLLFLKAFLSEGENIFFNGRFIFFSFCLCLSANLHDEISGLEVGKSLFDYVASVHLCIEKDIC